MNKDEQKIVPELRFSEFGNNWKKVKLKDVSTYFNGKSFEGNVKEEGKYELITLKSVDASGNLVHSKRYIDDEVPTLSKGTLVMILSEQAPGLLGMTAIIPFDDKFVLNQRVAEIRPNEKVESFFLSMAINRNQSHFSRLGAGMKVQNISKPNVENYEFFIPTLAEQQKIASCLSSLDNLITAETEKLDHLKNHKNGLLQQLFPAVGETKPQFRFPEFEGDGDWIETTLGSFEDLVSGDGDWILSKDISVNETYKIVQLSSIGFGIFKNKVLKTISEETFKKLKGTPIYKGDLLVNRMVDAKKINNCIFPSEGNYVTSVDVCWIRENKYFNNYFLMNLLCTHHNQQKLLSLSSGAGRVRISKNNFFEKFIFLLPENPKEQQKIASCLSSIDDTIGVQTSKIEALKDHKKGLMQQLFPSESCSRPRPSHCGLDPQSLNKQSK